MTLRNLGLVFLACSALGCAPAAASPNDSRGTREWGDAAARDFYDSWKKGSWDAFLQHIDERDFVFQFPGGPFKGRFQGDEAVRKFREWAADHVAHGNRIDRSDRDLVLVDGDWYVFADHAWGTFFGHPYESRHAMALRFGNGKIKEYREYVGDLTDWIASATPAADAASGPLGVNEVRALVYEWFSLFDRNAPFEAYLQHVTEDDGRLVLRYPEATLHGREEFRRWYSGILQTIRSPSHDIGRLDVTVAGTAAHIDMEVVWRATTVQGEARRLKVRQIWDVERGAGGRPLIRSLSVHVLEG